MGRWIGREAVGGECVMILYREKRMGEMERGNKSPDPGF